MTHKLPEKYPRCEMLPFNRSALEEDFQLEHPTAEPDAEGVWLLLQGTRLLLDENGCLPDHTGAAPLLRTDSSIYVGRWQNRPCRLQAVSMDANLPKTLQAINILEPEPGLQLSLLSLAGLGNAILHWEKTSHCCDNCGGEMRRVAGEWGKKCCDCEALHYPRIHPCIIVLVQRGEEILLVRKPEWAAGRFGLVAGFVEFGENLEQCVERELFEETGIRVENIRYRGSQSWPFPSQLMTGFSADYQSGDLKIQEDELAEGGWYPLDALPQLPPRRSIARWLIDSACDIYKAEQCMIED